MYSFEASKAFVGSRRHWICVDLKCYCYNEVIVVPWEMIMITGKLLRGANLFEGYIVKL